MQLSDEQRALIQPFLGKYRGREVNIIDDAFLVEFASSPGAVRCAVLMREHPVDAVTGLASAVRVAAG